MQLSCAPGPQDLGQFFFLFYSGSVLVLVAQNSDHLLLDHHSSSSLVLNQYPVSWLQGMAGLFTFLLLECFHLWCNSSHIHSKCFAKVHHYIFHHVQILLKETTNVTSSHVTAQAQQAVSQFSQAHWTEISVLAVPCWHSTAMSQLLQDVVPIKVCYYICFAKALSLERHCLYMFSICISWLLAIDIKKANGSASLGLLEMYKKS